MEGQKDGRKNSRKDEQTLKMFLLNFQLLIYLILIVYKIKRLCWFFTLRPFQSELFFSVFRLSNF